jgi:hypothetical protein
MKRPEKTVMRISQDRYQHERKRMELALRMLRHEARTQTIRGYTGLSDDRIRKLYRSYLGDARRQHPRHRGKSPHQISYFTRSSRREETAVLASVLSLLDALPAGAVRNDSEALLARGELLCQGFEAYRQLLPAGQISFEHAFFLVNSLQSAELLRLGNCNDCGCLMVTERLPLRGARCSSCTAG